MPELSTDLCNPSTSVPSPRRTPRARDRQRMVRILNPVGSCFTSIRRAKDLVERGHAIFQLTNGQITGLQLLDGTVAKSLNEQYTAQHVEFVRERDIARMRNGVFYWNGTDHHPQAAHRPGENVFLAKPGRSSAIPWIQAQTGTEEDKARTSKAIGSRAIQVRPLTIVPPNTYDSGLKGKVPCPK